MECGGTIASNGMHMIVQTIVPKGRHTTVAPLVDFACSFLQPLFCPYLKQKYWSIVPVLLAGHGRCPHGSNAINIIIIIIVTGALQELGVALVKGTEVVYREALHVYATAGGTAARVGATVPTVDPE
jgi:hypothetical protein